MAELDARRAEVLSSAAKSIQRQIRTHIARKQFIAMRKAAICIQSLWRRRLACKQFEHMRRESAAIKIQKNLRRFLARRAYTRLRISVLVLQTGVRAMSARNQFRLKKQTKAAIIIQAHWRCHRATLHYKKLKRASVLSQCRWRGKVARRELRKRKMAAKETGALKEAKDKLEKRVEELTWRLQLEKRLRTDLEEAKGQEITKLQASLQSLQNKADETNALLIKERDSARKAIEEAPPVIKETPVVIQDTEKIDSLIEEVERLKASLQSEKERADDFEKKYTEVQESNEERRKKLEVTEGKVQQLQESLSRMIQCFSDQVSELKMILCTSPNSSSTLEPIDIDDRVDATSTAFTFQPSAPTPTTISSLTPDALRQIVQDLSPTQNTGLDNWENDREGAFDDFF